VGSSSAIIGDLPAFEHRLPAFSTSRRRPLDRISDHGGRPVVTAP
jgi:hypothetical protein